MMRREKIVIDFMINKIIVFSECSWVDNDYLYELSIFQEIPKHLPKWQ